MTVFRFTGLTLHSFLGLLQHHEYICSKSPGSHGLSIIAHDRQRSTVVINAQSEQSQLQTVSDPLDLPAEAKHCLELHRTQTNSIMMHSQASLWSSLP